MTRGVTANAAVAPPPESSPPPTPEKEGPPPSSPKGDEGAELSPRFYATALLGLVIAYVTVSFVMASLRFTGFFDENWDFGIFQQALWSTTHGHVLFEAGDYELLGVSSFFQVHPSFLLIALAGIYWVAPSAFTLLAMQSLVVGLAALPLYLLTRDITGSPRKALWVAAAFLVWLPLLSSQLYDFHLEAFLPLELFGMFLLWYRGRYWGAAGVATLAMLTLEVAPLFVFATAAFFALPPIRESLGRIARPLRSPQTSRDPGPRRPEGSLRRSFGAYVRRPSVLFSLLMAEYSVGFYVVLRLFQGPWVSYILGSSTGPSGPIWGFSSSSLGLSLSNLLVVFPQKVEYWILLYGLLLLIPLLKPRALLLAVPWLAFTFFSSIPNYVTIGYQYGTVAAFPVFVGMAYAMDQVPVVPLKELSAWVLGRSSAPPARGSPRPSPYAVGPPGPMRRIPVGTIALVGILVGGVLLSPITPWNLSSGIPESNPPGYWGRYNVPAGYAKVESLVSLIPSEASVVASTDLFPFVANNVNAYSTLWYPGDPLYLPFNVSHPPSFVLVSRVMWQNLPSWIGPLLSNPSYYGLRGYVGVSPVGWVKLYQSQYQGNVTNF